MYFNSAFGFWASACAGNTSYWVLIAATTSALFPAFGAGDTVPADARIVSGTSAVREDTFNGEHLPRTVTTGDAIYAGTVNVEGALQTLIQDGTLEAIIHRWL